MDPASFSSSSSGIAGRKRARPEDEADDDDRSGDSDSDSTACSSDSEESDSDSECDPAARPRFPYTIGTTFTVKKHTAPLPSGCAHGRPPRPRYEGWDQKSQAEYCFQQAPLDGTTHSEQRQIKITAWLHVGLNRGAQLVVVNKNLVAKIYDPMYYAGLDEDGQKFDVVFLADGDYSREAAAYYKLAESQAKPYIPDFHGSWTLEVGAFKKSDDGQNVFHTRHVRLILLEKVRGRCMNDINPLRLEQTARESILKKAIEAKSMISHCGVNQNDFCPRNILLTSKNYKDPNVNVKIVDFNQAYVHGNARYGKPDKLPNPIYYMWESMEDFSRQGWISDEDGEAEQWLIKQFRGDEKYGPLEMDDDGGLKFSEDGLPIPID